MPDIPIGGALLRLLGSADSADPVSTMADVSLVLNEILTSEEMRARCSTISSLVQDASQETRTNIARALSIILVTRFEPKEGPSADKDQYKPTTPIYAALCSPLPKSGWNDHIETKRKNSGAAEYAFLSPYLFSLIAAVEDLLNVQGHLLKR